MFGAFKRLFSKPDQPEAYPAPTPPASTPPAKPAAPLPAKPEPPRPAPVAPTPAPVAAAPVSQITPTPAPVADVATGEAIHLPLGPILAGLPQNLAALVVAQSSGTISIPVKTALAQLPTGAVRISYGELRRVAPPGTFSENATLDQAQVSLPLPPILAAINPELLKRRQGQKTVVVPENVTTIFGKHASFNAKAAVAAPESPAPAPAPAFIAPAPLPMPKPITPTPTPSLISTPAPVPSAPKPMIVPGASPFAKPPGAPSTPPGLTKPPAAAPLPSTQSKMPGMTPQPSSFARPPGATQIPSSMPKAPAPSPMPFAAPKPIAMPSPAAADNEVLDVPVSTISETWPAPVQQELAKLNLVDATVSLPMGRLDAALKAGRVAFTWGELSQWLKPAPAAVSPETSPTALDIPLKVIAPLFMAKRRPTAAKKQVAVAESIPNLFAGMAKAPEAVPPAAMTAPVAPQPIETAPAPAATVSALGQLFGQPEKAEWAPRDICAKISAMKGVAGSVMAMNDGLLMAGQVPPPLKPETIAAFAPQIFSRVTQYAGEMQLGPVTAVSVAAGQTPCTIYKTGKLYLTVLGHPGEALPEAALARIAAELTRSNP